MASIFGVQNGFYFFGTEVEAPEPGWVAIKDGAMFGGFGGGKGVFGVARGEKGATVILDKANPGEEILIPLHAVIFIHPSIDLYTFKGTTIR